jgi:pimeloyl-ACP methyl ester carboxylesterase/lysophospholipase L1-like esterase
MIKRFILFAFLAGIYFSAIAQEKESAWDNTADKSWSSEFVRIQIKSSADNSVQNAIFYQSTKSTPQPLIVSLHTWSGDYNQEDPLAKEVLLRDWNYIHPDFRGSNNNPEACGSKLVMADLEDAIRYAIENGNVDTENVHMIGVSGGGYAALVAFMKIGYQVKSFNAWASISDLENWFWETKGRNLKYAYDVEKVATKNGVFSWQELRERSPMFMQYPPEKRKNSCLNIYAGVHDGYSGSVPISHSVLFYNKIAAERYPAQMDKLVPDSILLSLVLKQLNPNADTLQTIGGRKIHLSKKIPSLNLTIFEGTHEMLVPQALALPPIDGNKNLKPLHILTIGDSNGAFDFGWPQQMMKLLPFSTVINKSVAGNTIGFDNLDRKDLNTLTNIDQYLDDAFTKLGKNSQLDYIIIGLGTNDTKTIFIDRQNEVSLKMDILLKLITNYLETHNQESTRICVLSSPPLDEKKLDVGKYGGGDLRVQKNNMAFQKVTSANHADYLDTYNQLKINFSEKTTDGIHLNEKAQFDLASFIVNYINHLK